MDKFMEQFQFQLKFSADLTKFLKHESPAFQRLKETYEEVNEKREKLKTKGEDHEQGADIEKSNYDFREFLYHSMNEMEKSHKDLVMPILAEDVIKLKTLISDVQSLMIEDIRKHLNAKNKPKK